MANFDSPDLLSRARALLNRPDTDEGLTDAQLYVLLGDAQRRVMELLAFHCPESNYGAPTLLTTADSGATYTFGTDADGANICPIGHVELRESKTGAMIPPASEWDISTLAFLFNSDTIRWPGQKTRTFSDGPYARFIATPGVLTAAVAPVLKPLYARELIVFDAAERAAVRLGTDPTPFGQMFDSRFPEILATITTAFHGVGLTAIQGGGAQLWWRGMVR